VAGAADLTQASWFWPLVGIGATALVAAATGLLIGRRAEQRQKLLMWTVAQSTIVSGVGARLPGLELFYQGKAVPAASVARVVLWNSGSRAIKEDALRTMSPLRIVTPSSVEVRSVNVMHVTEGADSVHAIASGETPGGALNLDFRFLNPQAGFVVEIVHTGSLQTALRVEGTLVDVPPLVYVAPIRKYVASTAIYGGLLIGGAVGIVLNPFPKESNAATAFLFGCLFLIGFGVPILLQRSGYIARWQRRPPGSLNSYATAP
jgi:hypothetical protein